MFINGFKRLVAISLFGTPAPAQLDQKDTTLQTPDRDIPFWNCVTITTVHDRIGASNA
jgi:hypothetical protein